MLHQHLHQKPKHYRRSAQPGGQRQKEGKREPYAGIMRQQISHAAKPAQEGHHARYVEKRDVAGSAGVRVVQNFGEATMLQPVRQMKLRRQVQAKHSRKKGERAQHQSHEKAGEIKSLPGHDRLLSAALRWRAWRWPLPPCERSGFSTCSRRSMSCGVSKIAASSARHFRESSCLASSSSAWLSSGSRRKRSAPLTSHRSSRPSSAPQSEMSSVW